MGEQGGGQPSWIRAQDKEIAGHEDREVMRRPDCEEFFQSFAISLTFI